MNCQICLEKINEYLDNELDSKVTNEINLHLENCSSCKTEYEFLKQIIEKANELNVEPPKELKQNVLEKINAKEKTKKIFYFRRIATSLATTAAVLVLIILANNSINVNKLSSQMNTDLVKENETKAEIVIPPENAVSKGSETNSETSKTASANIYTANAMDNSLFQAQDSAKAYEYKYFATFNGNSINNIETIKELIYIGKNDNIYEYKTTLSIKEIEEKLKVFDILLDNSQESLLINSSNYGNIKINIS